jgi:hypothetical protein
MDMRNPRLDPQQGDVLEHYSGQRRLVLARAAEDAMVRYREGDMVADCSETQWREWAKDTSILDFG